MNHLTLSPPLSQCPTYLTEGKAWQNTIFKVPKPHKKKNIMFSVDMKRKAGRTELFLFLECADPIVKFIYA